MASGRYGSIIPATGYWAVMSTVGDDDRVSTITRQVIAWAVVRDMEDGEAVTGLIQADSGDLDLSPVERGGDDFFVEIHMAEDLDLPGWRAAISARAVEWVKAMRRRRERPQF